MSRLYWVGVSLAAGRALNIDSGGSILSAMLESPGKPIHRGGFRSMSRQHIDGKEFIGAESVKTIVCRVRSALADVGLGGTIKTVPGGYLVEKHDAERVLAFIEDFAGK